MRLNNVPISTAPKVLSRAGSFGVRARGLVALSAGEAMRGIASYRQRRERGRRKMKKGGEIYLYMPVALDEQWRSTIIDSRHLQRSFGM